MRRKEAGRKGRKLWDFKVRWDFQIKPEGSRGLLSRWWETSDQVASRGRVVAGYSRNSVHFGLIAGEGG